MTQIPRPALWLGLAGLIPFFWGVAGLHSKALDDISTVIFGPDPRLNGAGLVLSYGIVILSFMSGVLWGFATRVTTQAGLYYTLSALPALWAQFFVSNSGLQSLVLLAMGYLALLALDWVFATKGLTPAWWMRLRILLTTGVLASIALAALGSGD